MKYYEAKKILNSMIKIVGKETIATINSYGRVLAEDLISSQNVPSFDRSPYDGYCFDCDDSIGASSNNPVYFDIIEEVPCGEVAKKSINKFEAIKILTGAKMPKGANCVVKYEDVVVKDNRLEIRCEFKNNQNVILAGEDVKNGEVIAKIGNTIDIGVVGIFASLGINKIDVYKNVKIGFLSTGSELVEIDQNCTDGKIYNSNRYIFDAIFKKLNITYKYYGIVSDDVKMLESIFDKASSECDIVISTGGVSVGDYDLVEKALVDLGFDVFVNGIDMKPGMACCFAEKNDKFVLGLSGNPMSAITTFYAVCLPAIKKMMGYSDFENKYFKVRLKNSCTKKVGKIRFLRGKVDMDGEMPEIKLNLDQGNIVIKSLIDCNAMIKVENNSEIKEGMIFDCMFI